MTNPFHYHSDNSHERIYLNEFGKYLRDQADKDYIASRSLYRRDMTIHAANLAHQSVEKYLKAVLLFIAKDTRKFSHDIVALLNRNLELGLVLGEQSKEVVRLLDGLHNASRYQGSGSFNVDYSFIYYLDYFVRDIRPWVQNRSVREEWLSHPNPKRIYSGHDYKTARIISGGYLEKVSQSEEARLKKLREDLIWNNLYFGKRKRKKILVQRGSCSSSFPFNLDSENGRNLAKYVSKLFKFESPIERALNLKDRPKQ